MKPLAALGLVVVSITGAGAAGCAGDPDSGVPDEIAYVEGGTDFVSDGIGSVVVIGADGKQRRRVTHGRTSSAPTWSPSGAEIAYGSDGGIVIARVVDGSQRRLREASCYDPVWSPAGARIACSFTEPWQITVVDTHAGDARIVSGDCCLAPAWSPDGQRIAYYDIFRSELQLMHADGSGKRRLLSKSPHDSYPSAPSWSPDGRRIAAVGGNDVWVVNADGTAARKILVGGDRATKAVVWSPDGELIALTRGDGDFEIFVMNPDGTGLRNLTDNAPFHDEDPAWSPDGRMIAFTSTRDGNAEIYVMRRDGSNQERLTNHVGDDLYPRWSPRG